MYMFKKMKKRFRGFLTSEDIKVLEEASVRQPKYKKVFVKKWSCGSCNYNWFYNSMKCPSCASPQIKEMGR